MKQLRISPELSIPDDVVTATSVVYGGKGMGKTNLASVLVEEATKARLRWAVLDPMGVFWGIRHSKDGSGSGVECVVLGGPHGDIPIEPTSGEIVADLVIDEGVNTVIDFSRKKSGEMWGKNEKIRFVTDYALRLFRRQGDLLAGNQRREPLLQILDEAARYIPQIIPSGAIDLAKCVGAWEQAAEEGRNIGLGVCFLTQRSARMNKSVSELADVMFAFRTIGPNSLAAVMDWLGEHIEKSRIREVAGQVRELEVGQCLVVSPGWLRVEKVVKIRERETFDSSATPKPGQRAHKVTGKAAKPDLAKYEQRMAATIEKAKADDPKELRAEIARLKREVEKRVEKRVPATMPIKVDHERDKQLVERAVERAVAGERDRLRRWRSDVEKLSVRLDEAVGRVQAVRTGVQIVIDEIAQHVAKPGVLLAPVEHRPNPPSPVVSRSGSSPEHRAGGHAGRDSRERPAVPTEGITAPQQRILNALAEFANVGQGVVSASNAAAFANQSATSSSTERNFANLRKAGLIDYPRPGFVTLTADGERAAICGDSPMTLSELHDRWTRILGGKEGEMLRVLIRAHPDAVEREELARETNQSTSSSSWERKTALLRGLGLAEYPSSTAIIATSLLFPEGLR